MNWLKLRLRKWLGVEGRLLDLEKHFVTKRDIKTGQPTQTLADVPLSERTKLRQPAGMTWAQRKAWLEETDGGRKLNA